jgi:uncharacterized protein (TIGR02145 family)
MKKVTVFLVLVFLSCGALIIHSCKKDPVMATLTTSAVTNVTVNSATSGGSITDDGGAEVTARGVCWGTSSNPSVSDSHTTDDKGVGSFVSNITGLTPNTLYHVRAYATNSAGTAYGNEVTFTSTPIVVATLTTTAVTSITLTAAVSGGNITADGNAAVTAKGVCWATTTAPTISNSKTSDGTGTGSFTSSLSGLLPNTKYYLRAYATNSAGTSYGNEVSFTTSQIAVPTLTTTAVTSITLTTAVSGGNITADGGGAVTAKGVCWATTANPTTSDPKTVDGTGTGSFTSSLSGLLPATTYHLRAYATNSSGTAYGNDVTFTTSPIAVPTLTTTAATSVTLSTALSGGNITADGGGAITARGVCWTTTADPTINDSKTTDGTGTGSFISSLAGLLPGTTYHIRAYATNSSGTAYGNDVSFTTSPIAVPTLTTTAVTSVTLTTAVSGGNITADGGGAITARGICWATTTTPTISNFLTTDGTGSGSFTSNLSVLLPATTYYVRAYATNSAGTAYGNEVSFTTGLIVPATLTTTAATSIGLTTAVSGGNITANGGGAVTARGVCWATTATPTISNFITTDGTGSGSFTSNLSGLQAATTYHVRAYATNSAGTAYGNEITFTTTQIVVPTLTTTAATSITLTAAVSGGNISADGGGTITARGTCWAITANPSISDSKTVDGTGTGIFTSNLAGLLPGTIYHVRAYATNSAGTAYGNDLSFTTTAIVVPTLTTTAVTSITLTTAASGGNITADGGGSVTARGVCWATTVNPTITDPKTTNGTGTGVFTSGLTTLLPGTIYHVRAYATNSAGTAYGNDISFTTTAVALATLTTATATSITTSTAVSGGNITADGGGAITARGVCWAITANPTIINSITTNGSGTGSFISNLSGLLPGTLYHLRAYATNSAGTAYGSDITFTTTAAVLPTLTTTAVSSIALTTAVSGGNITSDGGGAVTARGVCWAITASPTISDNVTSNGTGIGSFTSNLAALLPSGTTYYVRAYATNSTGTAYGNQFIFTTDMADGEGNNYNTVRIGTQVWMAENLRATRYNENTVIPNVTGDVAWMNLNNPAYCWYNNDGTAYKNVYGAIYNWFTANTGVLCPTGWHVPSDAEFNTLELYLGISLADIDNWGWRGTNEGAQMKNTVGWAAGENGTNTSGFSGLPGGYRYGASGAFNDVGNLTYWWSSTENTSTEAWYRRLDGNNSGVYKASVLKQGGKYVRCMKN